MFWYASIVLLFFFESEYAYVYEFFMKVNMFMCMSVLCVWMSVCEREGVCMSVCERERLRERECVRVCVRAYVYACVYMHVCVYACVYMHGSISTHTERTIIN